jgi:hypothetical protein
MKKNKSNNTLLWLAVAGLGAYIYLNPTTQSILAGGGGQGLGSSFSDLPSGSLNAQPSESGTGERNAFSQAEVLRSFGADGDIRIERGTERTQLITTDRESVADFIRTATEQELQDFGATQATIVDKSGSATEVFDFETNQSFSVGGDFQSGAGQSVAREFGGGVKISPIEQPSLSSPIDTDNLFTPDRERKILDNFKGLLGGNN